MKYLLPLLVLLLASRVGTQAPTNICFDGWTQNASGESRLVSLAPAMREVLEQKIGMSRNLLCVHRYPDDEHLAVVKNANGDLEAVRFEIDGGEIIELSDALIVALD